MNGENYTRKCFINTALLRILLGRLYKKKGLRCVLHTPTLGR